MREITADFDVFTGEEGELQYEQQELDISSLMCSGEN